MRSSMTFRSLAQRVSLLLQVKRTDNKYLFILSPPFSGSTLLMRILETSQNVSSFGREGQFMPSVRRIMGHDRWCEDKRINWSVVRRRWHRRWDFRKEILLEKSPPNILRAGQIIRHFLPSNFILLMRNPYAFCESYRRHVKADRTFSEAAQFWVRCAEAQKTNAQTLKNSVRLSYEELVAEPDTSKEKLSSLLGKLSDISFTMKYRTRTLGVRGWNKITDQNKGNIQRLKEIETAEINTVLERYPSLLSFFNYQLRKS